MKRILLALSVATLALAAFTAYTYAQTAPLPPGGVTLGTFSPSNCPGGTSGGWVPNMSCAKGTVTCDISLGVADLGSCLATGRRRAPTTARS